MGQTRPAGLLIFWDYDTQWGGDRSRSGKGPRSWGRLDFENTEQLLEIHERFEVPSCFAVVGSAALPGERPYHDPGQIRRIQEAGHEIASHSFRHDWLPRMTRKELLEDLRSSKDALESCLGNQVVSFVPPYNQPRDYPWRLSFSLSERREAGAQRTGLPQLCECLHETGFQFSRISYRPLPVRAAEWALRRKAFQPSKLEIIAGVRCLRTNSEGGFAEGTIRALQDCVQRGGLIIATGHPHSLSSDGPQSRAHLEQFLACAVKYRDEGRLKTLIPSQLLHEELAAAC